MTSAWPQIGHQEAERAFLGALMQLPPETVLLAVQGLSETDFAVPLHAEVFAGIVGAFAECGGCDPVLVDGWMRRHGLAESLDNQSSMIVFEVFASCDCAAMWRAYRAVVTEHAWRRQVWVTASRLVEAAVSGSAEQVRELIAVLR